MNDTLGRLEEVRLRNLQASKDILKRNIHWTDDDISGRFLKMHEDLVLMAWMIKRLVNRFSD